MHPARLASTVLAAAFCAGAACAAPASSALAGVTAPFVDPSAVEGGTIPRLDPATISAPMKLCGWWDNPTPGNVWLDDRSGQWTIAMQGMYEAKGPWPDFEPSQQLPKGSPHGFGCACISARVDPASRFVYAFSDTHALPLKVCLADPTLKGRRPDQQ